MRFTHFSRGWGLAVYFEILVRFKSVEKEVHFINAFIYVPMTAIPRFVAVSYTHLTQYLRFQLFPSESTTKVSE